MYNDHIRDMLLSANRCEECSLYFELGHVHICGETGVWFEDKFCTPSMAMKLESVKRTAEEATRALDAEEDPKYDPEVEAEMNRQIILGALHDYALQLDRLADDAPEGSAMRFFLKRKLKRCRDLVKQYSVKNAT